MTAERLFLGMDGGGTRCRARLCAATGALLGEGMGGPANIRLGMETAWTSITHALDGALTAAGLGLAGTTNAAARLTIPAADATDGAIRMARQAAGEA